MAEAVGNGAGTPQPVEVVDDRVARVRRPVDLFRLAGVLLLILLVGFLATVAENTVRGVNQDLTRLIGEIPHLLVRALSLLGAFGALALPIVFVIREILRGHPRRLVEGLLTGVLAVGMVGLLDTLISADSGGALNHALTQVGASTTVRPLDAYLAALFALVVVIGATRDPQWRLVFWVTIGIYFLSVFTAAQASPLSLAASPAIGAAVGLAVRYTAGGVNERPTAMRVAEELNRRGLDVIALRPAPTVEEPYRGYLAATRTGPDLSVQVFDRDTVASGAVYGLYRRMRISTAIAAPPALSLERVAERRTLLALAAMAAGARVPRFVAGVPCGPETIVLVYELVPHDVLEHPTDAELVDLWHNIAKLHRARMTHRGVTSGSILADAEGRAMLPAPAAGAAFASDLGISVDRAQVLIATAQLVGAERAVGVARTVLSDDELAATVPLLQPIALPREIRRELKKDASLLESIREQVRGQTLLETPEPVKVERIRPRVVVSIVTLIVAGYLIVGQLGSVDLGSVLSTARWSWVPFVLLASAATYLAAALSLMGYVRERLSFLRTTVVQVAASFVGFVTPPSVGGLALNIRYLRKSDLSPAGAATSVGMSQVINAVSHAVLLIVFAAATGTTSHTNLPIPGWAFFAVGALAALLLLLLAVPRLRRWLLARAIPPLREAGPRLVGLLSSPLKLGEALTGTLLLNAGYIAALWFSVHAFAGQVGLAAVAVVYLAGAAVASLAPTPGGLGAVEIALSTGLVAAGMPGAAALSAVLLFRLATYWLPVPAGWVALHYLQRVGAV